jgi:hypothetical protein
VDAPVEAHPCLDSELLDVRRDVIRKDLNVSDPFAAQEFRLRRLSLFLLILLCGLELVEDGWEIVPGPILLVFTEAGEVPRVDSFSAALPRCFFCYRIRIRFRGTEEVDSLLLH